MSFSSDVKRELCRLPADRPCCVKAEIYGALLFGHTFRAREARIVTESPSVAGRLVSLCRAAFGFDFDRRPADGPAAGKATLLLSDRAKLSAVREAFGYGSADATALHLNNAVLEDECCTRSFVRGTFLTGGSMMRPDRKYHLELVTPHGPLSREVLALLRALDFTPRITLRTGHHVIYLKASEQIEDFLTAVGAPRAALTLMETKVEKDLRNRVNRKVNCETANLGKTVAASMEQIDAIERLRVSPLWETLPAPLRETAELRLRYPDQPLTELCARFDPPLGRSGLNHRLRKLTALARETERGGA
ncbi:MAG: DNA-binding protein WhiA [Oscillospiraceae bacterium]|nr:DNA-binding protein WhiA [Oscillospiraceae bacterium]